MPKRRPPQEFIQDITVEDDGIRPVRECHDWTRDKLGILTSYLAAYGRACKSAPRGFYFTDAMAGSGFCHIEETDEYLLGSTLIALRSEPPFRRCLSLELSGSNAEALRRRTEGEGGRSIVLQGDCNRALEAAMDEHIPRNVPHFVLLDPEGAELEWQTIRAVARHRLGPRKAEILILFPTEGMNRMLPVESEIALHNEMRLNQLFPPDAKWREVWQRRLDGVISPADARREYVLRYGAGLTQIGYKTVLHRTIERTSGSLVYHLVFATDDDAGERIMADVFGAMHSNQPQLRLGL